ncbi:MAG TPA: baseplate J/gp47 family protein [Chroococcales cyanobacterium]
MPIPLPNLDDRTWDDLVEEGLTLIPSYTSDWTNFNPSDPGITLIELLAYLSEMQIYRLNRVTNANKQAFLNLIVGLNPDGTKKYPAPLDEAALNSEIRKAVLMLRQSDRAIARSDFENLALAANESDAVQKSGQKVARARCLPRHNLDTENYLLPSEEQEQAGHVSIVILPDSVSQSTIPQPNANLISSVKNYLDERRPIATQIHVVGPYYLSISVQITLHLQPDAIADVVQAKAVEALKTFFDPYVGGRDGNGWSFGRNIYVSEVYQLLDQLPGVDYVTRTPQKDPITQQTTYLNEITVINPNFTDRMQHSQDNLLTAILLRPEELVDAQIHPTQIQIIPSPSSQIFGTSSGG